MAKLKAVAIILVLFVFVAACETDGGRKAVPPTPPQKVEQTVRPAGEYFLYPGPDPVFLALPQVMVIGGSKCRGDGSVEMSRGRFR